MAIDFDSLVIGPAMEAFAEPFEVWPGGDHTAAYQARGSWSDRPVDIPMSDGMIGSGQVRTIAIRRSEWADDLAQSDWVKRLKDGALYIIDDVDDDGQGGSLLTVKQAEQ